VAARTRYLLTKQASMPVLSAVVVEGVIREQRVETMPRRNLQSNRGVSWEENCVVGTVVVKSEWLCRGPDGEWEVVVQRASQVPSLGQQSALDALGVVVGGKDWWVLGVMLEIYGGLRYPGLGRLPPL
jgi:hypothetical protein